VKIAQGIRPCGAFIFHILITFQQKFQLYGSYTLMVAPMGVKFGVEEGTVPSSTLKFTPSVQRVAFAGQKTSKSASE